MRSARSVYFTSSKKGGFRSLLKSLWRFCGSYRWGNLTCATSAFETMFSFFLLRLFLEFRKCQPPQPTHGGPDETNISGGRQREFRRKSDSCDPTLPPVPEGGFARTDDQPADATRRFRSGTLPLKRRQTGFAVFSGRWTFCHRVRLAVAMATEMQAKAASVERTPNSSVMSNLSNNKAAVSQWKQLLSKRNFSGLPNFEEEEKSLIRK